jgi:hypothetical protein
VITEYRRFIYLAATSRAGMTPSKAVDEAWHLHLTYSENYRRDLCEGVLGRPLYHHPGDGSASDVAKYRGQYQNTLARYRNVFGTSAPADVWPHGNGGAKPSEPTAADTHLLRAALAQELRSNQEPRRLALGSIVAVIMALALAAMAFSVRGVNKTAALTLIAMAALALLIRFLPKPKRRGAGDGGGGGSGSACGSSCGGGSCGGGCGG